MRLGVLALLVQAAHFVEELRLGFHEAFPDLLGLGPWSPAMFASFNLTWIAAWIVSIVGIRLRWRAALFPVWFLGLACVLNAAAHPLLALMRARYFPGLWTSPFSGVAGWFLLKRMAELTAAGDP